MRIEIISGSPREKSLTRRVAHHLADRFNKVEGIEASIIDMKDWSLPPVQSVFSSVETTPEEFRPLAERVFNADAFVLVTPEYNGSYSPSMKNLLDHFPKRHRKPFGIVTASPGALGGMRAAQQLLLLVPALFGIASPYLLVVPSVDKKFSPDGDLLDESFEHTIRNFISEFTWLSQRLTEKKEEAVKISS